MTSEIEIFVRLKYNVPDKNSVDWMEYFPTYPASAIRNAVWNYLLLIENLVTHPGSIECIKLSKAYKDRKIYKREFLSQDSIKSSHFSRIEYKIERLFYHCAKELEVDYFFGFVEIFLDEIFRQDVNNVNIFTEILIQELYLYDTK